MVKSIALLKRKAGLSREEFIAYYENNHAPLMRELLPEFRDYRRNYIDLDGAFIYPGADKPDFDVITEMWFADRSAYESAIATATNPEVADRIARDEENFLDRSKTRMFVVEERSSNIR